MRERLPAHYCHHVFTPACPVDCLRAVLSMGTFHALARAEDAPFDPPATVGQVVELLRAGRLGEIWGLGPRRLGEIEVGLVLAGFDISGGIPPVKDRPPHAPRSSQGYRRGEKQEPPPG